MIEALEVLRPGALTTVQDLGRPGLAHLGVPRSGAADRPAHTLANRLAGNPPDAATLETTLTGVRVRALADVVVAVTGAYAQITVDGVPAPWGEPIGLGAGATLTIGTAKRGVRSYLAVAGGIAVPPTLGSRSYDVLSGLGPQPLRAGDVLPAGEPAGPPAWAAAIPQEYGDLVLPLEPGPRTDWCATPVGFYTVSAASNRIALRLDGPPVARLVPGELPSEGLVPGAVQIPPDGQPVIFLADHPVTGGYPVVGVVGATFLAACAQARPGTKASFTR
ncbi:biotin-dependent carboxyltransferase family protein [Longispora albida]|uniref:5-oxoprolinase subunit C family protein n=1 Tax=Longispora albida TaxID=203523 RepID=UPI00037EFBB8|nr:biotin-dependent carboxyltransferase family protein [Longispora albida]